MHVPLPSGVTLTNMATKKIEDGIRAYLKSLVATSKPAVDREAVKALTTQVKEASDPIEKLRLLAALEEERAGRTVDNSGEKAVFIAEAKPWAEAEGIPVSAFQTLRVPDAVLREAGFTLPTAPPVSVRQNGSAGRAPRVPLDDVKVAVTKLGDPWKLNDLARSLDRDVATVRNYVLKLIEQGLVKVLGDDPSHDGRGRAAKLYSSL
jgi:hypothetical protein